MSLAAISDPIGAFVSDAALSDDTPMARSLAGIEGMLSGEIGGRFTG